MATKVTLRKKAISKGRDSLYLDFILQSVIQKPINLNITSIWGYTSLPNQEQKKSANLTGKSCIRRR